MQRPGGTNVRALRREQREVAGGEPEIGQRVGAMAVEPRRQQEPRRPEPLDRRRDQLVERLQVDVAGGARRQRDVHRRRRAGARAGLGDPVPSPGTAATGAGSRTAPAGRPRTRPGCRCRGGRRSRAPTPARPRRRARRRRPRCWRPGRSPSNRSAWRGGPAGGRRRTPPRRPPREARPPRSARRRRRAAPPRPSACSGWCRRRSTHRRPRRGVRAGPGTSPDGPARDRPASPPEARSARGPRRDRRPWRRRPPPVAGTAARDGSARSRARGRPRG